MSVLIFSRTCDLRLQGQVSKPPTNNQGLRVEQTGFTISQTLQKPNLRQACSATRGFISYLDPGPWTLDLPHAREREVQRRLVTARPWSA